MAEEKGLSESAAARVSLRDTAKWIAGGVAVTAAGVLTGASLTNLGALDSTAELGRLVCAVLGAAIALFSLGWLMRAVLDVLTIEGLSLQRIAEAEGAERADPGVLSVAGMLVDRHRKNFPVEAENLTGLLGEFDKVEARSRDAKISAERAAVAAENAVVAADFSAMLRDDAAFLWVRLQFDRMVKRLPYATFFTALGLLLFAWGANPGKREDQQDRGSRSSVTISSPQPVIREPCDHRRAPPVRRHQ